MPRLSHWLLPALCAALTTLTAPAAARAQAPAAKPVGLSGLAREVTAAAVTSSGELLIAGDFPGAQSMAQVVAGGTLFQVQPVLFEQASMGELKLKHVAVSEDDATWALADDAALVREAGQPWRYIKLPPLDQGACRARRTQAPCQRVVPLGQTLAIVLRPAFEVQGSQRVLSTQILALSSAREAPVGALLLPNVTLGEAISDSAGGFWVALERVAQTRDHSDLRGYLRYVSGGTWQLWSDSGEAIEGTTLMGRVRFLVDTRPGRMSADGQGGFWMIGQDQVMYRVSRDGVASRFDAGVVCQYCKRLALAYEPRAKVLHVLTAQWREGEAGQRALEAPLGWARYDINGSLLGQEPVPLPARYDEPRAQLALMDSARLHARAGQLWLSTPQLLMHRDAREWSWLGEVAQVEQVIAQQTEAQKAARPVNPVSELGAKATGVSLAAGGLVGAYLVADQRHQGRGALVMYTGMISFAASLYPALWYYPYLVETGDPAPLRWSCLGGGALGLTLFGGAGAWWMGESLSESVSGERGGGGRRFLGATAGAAAGTALSSLVVRWLYGANPNTTQWWAAALGSAMVGSFATLGYVLAD